MHHTMGMPLMRRLSLVAAGVAMLAVMIAPAMASALSPSTLRLSTVYQSTAKTFTASGTISKSVAGKRMTLEIRKPGRTFWTVVATPKIGSTGAWSAKYYPKLKGSFYIRARYASTSVVSRTAKLYVKKGPGKTYEIYLASTTSTRDSGLFEALRPAFLHDCPEYSMKAVFVGSGAAIAKGGTGDADVLLTHSPAAEVDFMNGIVAGAPSAFKGLTRFKVMYNDFVLVGPGTDPANIDLSESAKAAFQKVADTGSTFISRNDNSGTNAKEKEIWASLTPANPQLGKTWYKASGTMGMAAALSAASQQNAYTLADRATWLTAKNLGTTGSLIIVNEGDAQYFNQYAVIEVAKAANWEGAQDFRRWIMSSRAQNIIKGFGIDTYGRALFVPNAGPYPW